MSTVLDAPGTRVLLVTCGEPDPSVIASHGRFVDFFRAGLGPTVALREVDARVEPLPVSLLDDVDAVIVSGSSHSTYDPLPWLQAAERFVRAAMIERAVPLLGVCFGHQLLAQACGGAVARNPRGREMGTLAVALHDEGRRASLFHGLPERFAVQMTHCDTVLTPPPGAVVLASSDRDDCQAMALGSAVSVQFHPEFSAEVLKGYVRARAGRVRADGLDPEALLATIHETPWGHAVLARFVEGVRRGGVRPVLPEVAARPGSEALSRRCAES